MVLSSCMHSYISVTVVGLMVLMVLNSYIWCVYNYFSVTLVGFAVYIVLMVFDTRDSEQKSAMFSHSLQYFKIYAFKIFTYTNQPSALYCLHFYNRAVATY